jgi:tryptophan halogenase
VSDNRIQRVLVAGDGIVAWSAAAALKRRLPILDVAIAAAPVPAGALADRIQSSLPSIRGFHADLGLSEADTVARAGSSFRLGTRFEGWVEGRPDYVHAYGNHGHSFGTTSFHNLWLRAAKDGRAGPFDAYSPAAAMARAGRFIHPQGEPNSPLATFDYGLTIDPPRYLGLLRAFARHVGVIPLAGTVRGARLRAEDGFIAALELETGESVAADLFVDCTGPAATLHSALDGGWQDWTRWLPCDRILIAAAAPDRALPVLDEAVAIEAGWRWKSSGRAAASHGTVYASAHLDDEAAARLLGHAGAPVSIRAGRRSEPWLRNCVAVGDAAVGIEPLEWTNLHLAHSAIDRIVDMMPGRDCAPIELAEYNRQCAAEADRVRDFAALHYLAARRPEPFWKDMAAVEPPASLAHTIGLFRDRGRLPFHEEETFARDSWLAVLIGQGVMPERVDPLVDLHDSQEAEAAMARMRSVLTSMVAALPAHADYLSRGPATR